jgi:hypothetical protein
VYPCQQFLLSWLTGHSILLHLVLAVSVVSSQWPLLIFQASVLSPPASAVKFVRAVL